MAKANHKARLAAVEEPIAFQVPLQGSAELPRGSNKPFIRKRAINHVACARRPAVRQAAGGLSRHGSSAS